MSAPTLTVSSSCSSEPAGASGISIAARAAQSTCGVAPSTPTLVWLAQVAQPELPGDGDIGNTNGGGSNGAAETTKPPNDANNKNKTPERHICLIPYLLSTTESHIGHWRIMAPFRVSCFFIRCSQNSYFVILFRTKNFDYFP